MNNNIAILGLPIDLWALILSIVAITLTLLKDFILPLFFRPRLAIRYLDNNPFRRKDVWIADAQGIVGTFIRFSIKNIGNVPALNCRCQISRVEKEQKNFNDYMGFPLRWASRPESVINQASGERLNIGVGETEFVDLLSTLSANTNMFLQKYHNVPIGINEIIPAGEYSIFVLCSGDNFSPKEIRFIVDRKNVMYHNAIKVSLSKG